MYFADNSDLLFTGLLNGTLLFTDIKNKAQDIQDNDMYFNNNYNNLDKNAGDFLLDIFRVSYDVVQLGRNVKRIFSAVCCLLNDHGCDYFFLTAVFLLYKS